MGATTKAPERRANVLRHGTKEVGFPMQPNRTPEERFWSKVQKTGSCWLWTGAVTGGAGYGNFNANGRTIAAHRYAYQLLRGPVTEGMVIDHLCRVRLCVNPDHLEEVSNRVNVIDRGAGLFANRARSTHCAQGHAFTDENTVRGKDGRRRCRTCTNLRQIRNRKAREARRFSQSCWGGRF